MYDNTCSDPTGATYVGSGVSNCFGITAGVMYADASGVNWVDINAYLFLPQFNANPATLGYRWLTNGTNYNAKVIANQGVTSVNVGNKMTAVVLGYANYLTASSIVLLTFAAWL